MTWKLWYVHMHEHIMGDEKCVYRALEVYRITQWRYLILNLCSFNNAVTDFDNRMSELKCECRELLTKMVLLFS